MREILLENTDYDIVNGETWTTIESAVLLTSKIAMYGDAIGINLYCFEKGIADDQPSVSTIDAKIIGISISGASVEGIDVSELASMSVAEFAEVLATQIN